MDLIRSKKRYKFGVQCCLEELTDVPFVSAVLFAKVRLLQGGNFQEKTTSEEVRNHAVRWDSKFQFVCKMCANASTGVLDPILLRISVRKESKGGRSYQKLGFSDVNLAELAGAGETVRRCLLEGYDPRRRQDNSVLRIRIRMHMIAGDPLFKVPSPSSKHVQTDEVVENNPNSANNPGATATNSESTDDCAASVASAASSGFGSLTKNPNDRLIGVGVMTMSEPGPEPVTVSDEINADGLNSAVGASCPACLQSHSRNSSNTSAEMSSKASGYGSSISQQSQHSRQNSDCDNDPKQSHNSSHTARKVLATKEPSNNIAVRQNNGETLKRKTNIKVDISSSPDTSEQYFTPNTTFSSVKPDLIPRSSRSNPTSPKCDTSFSMPTYFDCKKKHHSSTSDSPKQVQPLTNFQLLKQKSLNTIPDVSRKTKEESIRKTDEGLFTNFPFLTPLANRRTSLADRNRLALCNEDDFYCIISDGSEGEMDSGTYDVRFHLKSLSNQMLDKMRDDEVFSSTPNGADNLCIEGGGVLKRRFASERLGKTSSLLCSRGEGVVCWECARCGAFVGEPHLTPPARRHQPNKNPSSGSLTASASETGSLDRAKAAMERRKHKGTGGIIGLQNPVAENENAHSATSGRVENTRVNPNSLIDELLKESNIQKAVEDNAETSGLQLYIAHDGTTELGGRRAKGEIYPGGARGTTYKRVVVQPTIQR